MTIGLKAGILTTLVAGIAGGAYLLIPNATIEDALAKKIKLISKDAIDKVWNIAFLENKNSSELTEIKPKISDFNKLKEWCTKTYKDSSSNKETLNKVKKICEVPPSKMSEKLKKENKELASNWETKLNSIKQPSGKINELKKLDNSLNDIDTASNAKDKLEKWCKQEEAKELIIEKYEETYQNVIDFCI